MPYQTIIRLLVLHLMLGLLAVCSAARAEPPSIQLAAYRVQTIVQDGARKERLLTLDQIKPGDLIAYEATYTNSGQEAVGHVLLTVPVPEGGLSYVADGATPPPSSASLDGKVFSPMPLMRAQTLPDGRQVMRRVPLSEIRYLRWDLGSLQAGASRSVSARMQMRSINVALR